MGTGDMTDKEKHHSKPLTSTIAEQRRTVKRAGKGLVTMFMIMLGFTFFSASMWVGQQLAEGLDFWGFLGSLILGEERFSVPTQAFWAMWERRPDSVTGSSGQESLR